MSKDKGKVALVLSEAPSTDAAPRRPLPRRRVARPRRVRSRLPVRRRPTPALSNTTAAIRKGDGCIDTDDNDADFDVAAPSPRNTATAPALCAADGGGPSPTTPARRTPATRPSSS